VEVKGRGEYNNSFEITKYEVQKSYMAKELYQVILITHALDSAKRKIRNLGNLFMLENVYSGDADHVFRAMLTTLLRD
jgi:hypothetical protein